MTSMNLNASTSDFVKKLTGINYSALASGYDANAAKASGIEEAEL